MKGIPRRQLGKQEKDELLHDLLKLERRLKDMSADPYATSDWGVTEDIACEIERLINKHWGEIA